LWQFLWQFEPILRPSLGRRVPAEPANNALHYVKEQLGHASIQTTVDVYGHLAPGSNRNAVNKLDDDETPPLRLVSAAG
jgi:integrase